MTLYMTEHIERKNLNDDTDAIKGTSVKGVTLSLTLEELVHEFYFKLDSVLVNQCFKM